MVRELIHDPIFLGRHATAATVEDLSIARDLLDTLQAHKQTCVGMAANMIGHTKRIIAFDNEGSFMVMFNPEIIQKSGEYETEESCLSLLGGPRKTKRYQKNQSPLSERGVPNSAEDLLRLDSPNHSA